MDSLTLTVTSEDADTIKIYASALDLCRSLHDIMNHLEKYQCDRLAEMNGVQLVQELRETFWDMIPEIARG